MGEVRVFYAQGAPPSRGAISPAPQPSYLTQDRRALAGFGQAISQQGAAFLDHIQRVDVFNQTTEIEGATTESYSNFLNNLATDPDPSSYLSKYGEWSKAEQKNIDAMKNPESRRRAKGWFNKKSASWYNQVQSNATGRVIRDSKDELTLGTERAIGNRDPDALARAITKAFESGVIGEHGAALELERGMEEIAIGMREEAIENIKPDLVDAIAVNNKPEDGYEALDAATAQLVEDGILTEQEAAETNKKLGDWIDSYVSGRIKAAKEADKLTTMQSYRGLSKPILNGELTYEDIDNSDLRETRRTGEQVSDADRWRKYIKGSHKDAPTRSTPEGHTVSFAAVYDVATLQLSPKEGYDVLLEARFVDGSITNEQYEWAVDKIENPYPKHVNEDLKATMKSNLEDFNRLFRADDERNKKVNEALISWADEQIEKGKTPSKKEMFAMSSAFRAGGGQPHDIGAVIERGGQEWEIVGFDDDGEALVELIE